MRSSKKTNMIFALIIVIIIIVAIVVSYNDKKSLRPYHNRVRYNCCSSSINHEKTPPFLVNFNLPDHTFGGSLTALQVRFSLAGFAFMV